MDTRTASRPVAGPRAAAQSMAGWAGLVSAGLALGLTELVAGLTAAVPSAVSAVGGWVVDHVPAGVKDFAIQVFGTADKAALGLGTVIIGLVAGYVVGRLALRRRWVVAAAFGGFAVIGIAAAFGEPAYQPIASIVAIVGSAAVGAVVLDRLLDRLDAAAKDVPTDGLAGDRGRRRFLTGVVGVGATAVVSGVVGRSLVIRRAEDVSDAVTLPASSVPVAPPTSASSFRVPGLTPVVVPNDDFYKIDTTLVTPRPDVATWTVAFTGMVDHPFSLTYADLLAMPLVEEYVTLACVSNEVGDDLVGNALWTGIPLVDLLERAGVQAGADQVVGRSVDGFTVGFPTEVAVADRRALLAVGMNGVALPPAHGFPARLVVPGLYGYVSATKWLAEVELTTWDAFDAYWVPRGWAKEGPIKTQSRIDVPAGGATVPGDPLVAAGVAWAPTRGVAAVEVRVDDGAWVPAELSRPLGDAAWVQWRATAEVAPGSEHTLQVRATDGTGETQTETERPPAPDGATGWHRVEFTTA